MTHPSPKRNIVPKAVLMRLGLISLTTARPVNTALPRTTVNSARPMTNVFNKAHSTVRRLINNKTTTKNSNFNQTVNTAILKAVLNAEKGVIDSGCSRHMTGNMSYLTDFEEIDGGYVAFGGNPKGGKITGRGSGPNWLFDIDALTKSMNYKPFVTGNQSNGNAGTKACDDAGDYEKKVTGEPGKEGGDQFCGVSKDDKVLFFNGKIKEEVYVCQPPGFEDLDFPDRVYKRTIDTEPYTSKGTKDILLLVQFVVMPSLSVVSRVPPVVALIPVGTTSTPSSTIIDQDAPSASTLPTTKETQIPVIYQGINEQLEGTETAQFDNDPFYKIFTPESSLKNHHQGISYHQICIKPTNHLNISANGQRITRWTMLLAILLDLS
ncbi:hypothetical protein Tco_1093228 [Tanacetum coccineum]|uniref:Retrovirus-related Pol polyprotein from transposon TNT 1-94-like beta-barrel domain-containing protein n=1 Tax=Tanacetum coccineum TaxID=301880 RepID=A0ABQ5IDE8_9ASTR